jgi:hypothetical protein
MRKAHTILAIVGGIGLTATMAADLIFSGGVTVQVARGVTSGMILGAMREIR